MTGKSQQRVPISLLLCARNIPLLKHPDYDKIDHTARVKYPLRFRAVGWVV